MDGSFAFDLTGTFEEHLVAFWTKRCHNSPGFSAFSSAILPFKTRHDPCVTSMTIIFVLVVFGHV